MSTSLLLSHNIGNLYGDPSSKQSINPLEPIKTFAMIGKKTTAKTLPKANETAW